MLSVGIENMGFYFGAARLDVRTLAEARGLDMNRFDNLMMVEKSVPMPFEDPVSFAVNAAKPIVDELSPDERARVEMVITCSESGIDFAKSMSTYVHDHLGLGRNCRLFELKQACYCGTAGLQMAANFVLSQTSPGAKALVIATDIARFFLDDDGQPVSEDWSYAEPSSGAGAVAMLVGENPRVLQLDAGANGYYSYEVMDAWRPTPDVEAVDTDLSLMAYLECCEHAFANYCSVVEGADFRGTFGRLAFHTPFGGMVKGAHRQMLRKLAKLPPDEIHADFAARLEPSLKYPQLVGNIMGGTLFLALASTIDHGIGDAPTRIGLFSYGSGCSSEFFSGVIPVSAQDVVGQRRIAEQLAERILLSQAEYEQLCRVNRKVAFGTRDLTSDYSDFANVYEKLRSRRRLVLKAIDGYHRQYEWAE